MYDDADVGDAYGDYPYNWLLFELKSIDQALYNTGLLLPKAKYSLGIFINLVLWHHFVDDDDDVKGVHPNSHKHFIPYMDFCASIWDSVRHHCHHCHHHHHDHQK